MTREERIDQAVEVLRKQGPQRTLLPDGTGVRPKHAYKDFGIIPEIVFIRQDGWTLGVMPDTYEMGRKMWEDEWIGEWHRLTDVVIAY